MPIIGGLLVNLFGGFVAWLLQFVTRKVAYGIAAVTMMSGLTLALFIAMRAALAGLESALSGSPAMFLDAVAIAVPPVATFCLSTYVTIWTACTAYVWQRDLLQLAIKI
jgi:uncharacterized membrane protein